MARRHVAVGKNGVLTKAVWVLFAIAAISVRVSAEPIVFIDQSQTSSVSGGITVGAPLLSPFGQEFVPTHDHLDAVELSLFDFDSRQMGASFQLTIRVDNIIGAATGVSQIVELPDGFDGVVHFDFPVHTLLFPGLRHVININSIGGNFLSRFSEDQTIAAGGVVYHGFNIVPEPTPGPGRTDPGPNGIAWAFTGQAVLVMNYVDSLYGETTFQATADFYLNEIRRAQLQAPFGHDFGVVASTLDGGDILQPVDQCLSTPFQCVPERVGLEATLFAIFADQNYNLSRASAIPDGDFNDDGRLDLLDIDALIHEIAGQPHMASLDLTGDARVTLVDRDYWLTEAGEAYLASGAFYRLGDSILDGVVNQDDFDVWNSNRFTQVTAWSKADFNADGAVDGSDFGIWHANKFSLTNNRRTTEHDAKSIL